MSKPVIGLIAKHDDISKKRTESVLRDEMKDAVFHNGGIAIGIVSPKRSITLIDTHENTDRFPQSMIDGFLTHEEKENLIAQIKLCDGLILSGGPNSDDYEIFVANYAHKNDIPLLAICAGQNNFLRALGGTTKRIANPERHARPNDEYVHDIHIVKETKFHKIVQVDEMTVNSRHKNIVNDIMGLTVGAYDPDGNVEVLEDSSKKFFLSMRFHPESLYLTDDKHNAIFKDFVAVCQKQHLLNQLKKHEDLIK